MKPFLKGTLGLVGGLVKKNPGQLELILTVRQRLRHGKTMPLLTKAHCCPLDIPCCLNLTTCFDFWFRLSAALCLECIVVLWRLQRQVGLEVTWSTGQLTAASLPCVHRSTVDIFKIKWWAGWAGPDPEDLFFSMLGSQHCWTVSFVLHDLPSRKLDWQELLIWLRPAIRWNLDSSFDLELDWKIYSVPGLS